MIFVRPQAASLFNNPDALGKLVALNGDVYRSVPGRKTIRIDVAGRSFFLKVHYGVGWWEILKNIFQFKIPLVDAGNEWRAIEKLNEIGIPTVCVVAYGRQRNNPAARQSFIMTEMLHNAVDLESFCRNIFQEPMDKEKVLLKRRLIREVASIARRMHQNGINHQDFYLVHFLLRVLPEKEYPFSDYNEVLLFDLHRARVRPKVPTGAVVKDLAAVYFSSLDVVPFTRRDLLRFIREYRGKCLRDVVRKEDRFWQRVERRACRLYRKVWRKEPQAAVLKLRKK